MRRRSFLSHGGAVVAAGGTLASPATVRAQPTAVRAQAPVRWRLVSSFPRTLDTVFGGTRAMCERILAATDGGFRIDLFAAGEIVPPLSVLDAVSDGTVECGHTASYYYVGKDPTFAFDTALPFGLNARQRNAWMYYGGGHELLQGFMRGYGVTSLPAGNSGAQMAGWYRNEISGLADLKGLKLRIGGFGGQVMERLGVVPQQIAPADVYAALAAGTIDAAEWGGPLDDERLGFHKVAPYYYFPGWWDGGPQLSLLINIEAWEALSAAHQATLQSAAAELNVRMLARYDAGNPDALRRLLAGGTQLRMLPRDVMEAAWDAAFALYEETAAENPAFARIYRAWTAFRADDDLWFRVAENTFDNFRFARGAAGN